MAAISRNYLEGLKRPDLQKLCKDYGVKANLKSDALIDLILESQEQPSGSGAFTSPVPAPTAEDISDRLTRVGSKPPSRTATLRRSDRSRSRARNHVSAAVIVHDDFAEDPQEEEVDEPMRDVTTEHEQEPSARPPSSRARKTKETQLRLGVGRPVVAGGEGARTITKPPSVARGRRGKNSRSLPTLQPTIAEEEITGADEDAMDTDKDPMEVEASHNGLSSNPTLMSESSRDGYLHSIRILRAEFTQKLEDMRKDLEKLYHTEVGSLRDHVRALSDQLTLQTAKSASLEIEIRCLKAGAVMTGLGTDGSQPRLPVPEDFATPPAHPSNLSRLSVLAVPGPSAISASRKLYPPTLSRTPGPSVPGSSLQPILGAPGPSAVTLGKRPRADESSAIYEPVEREPLTQEDIARKAARPGRKRVRVSGSGEGSSRATSTSSHSRQVSGDARGREVYDITDTSADLGTHRRREPAFMVFTGPEEMVQDPPTSDAEPTPSQSGPGAQPARATSTAHQTENRNPFAFGVGEEAEQYPYLNPPGSRTPAPPVRSAQLIPSGASYGHTVTRAGGRRERNDLFHPFGTPPPPDLPDGPPMPSRGSVPPTGFLGSAAELRPTTPPAHHGPSSNDIGAGLGMTSLPPDTPAPPMKRTMYGTELEGDTRFGDFGVEGIATGFWAGGRF